MAAFVFEFFIIVTRSYPRKSHIARFDRHMRCLRKGKMHLSQAARDFHFSDAQGALESLYCELA